MPRVLPLLLFLPALCWAGTYDYYECVDPNGGISYSVDRCGRGNKQRRIADETPPESRSLGPVAGGLIRLQSGPGGHFYTTAVINGTPMRALVDTGASDVAISPSAARRARIDTRHGVQGISQTANGTTPVTGVVLQSVEVGGAAVRQVRASVLSQELGSEDVLLGMSFLRHFEVSTDGGLMTLRRK